MSHWVEGRLDWSPLKVGDIAEVAALVDACAYLDDAMEVDQGDELTELMLAADDLSPNGVVGRDKTGTVVAWGWLRHEFDPEPQGWLHWGVHPAYRYQHIEKQTVRWLTARADQWRLTELDGRPLWVGAHAEAKMGTRMAALEFNDYVDERWFCDLHVRLDDLALPPEQNPLQPPVRVVHFDRAAHSAATLAAHNQVFGPMRYASEVSEQEWEASLDSAAFRPEWSHVALDGDQVVGYALNSLADSGDWLEGWTHRIGVLPSHRRHGVGEALLRASLADFTAAGLEYAGVGVDTEHPEDALRLFTRLSYLRGDAVVLYGRVLA